ncbi:hypothetical protein XM38_033620 [Halomicronema hongdechloris C2206]|uniref:Metallohydrolase n=1 Tax=Halomicronema hongdechloris C2206 TaxID=1641165 RepID=A0A1Z3HQ40_9CYAN|nr:hypothetical protein [Halomicronema hongdechloris]ASC72405.1 hypothetical protein XM38_033620 [Halomicronema hongdechloris C2206]
MHKVIFYPVQNGDTSQIILSNGKRLLFDFRHLNRGEKEDDPAIDLKSQLNSELAKAKRDYFDVLALTHADLDHILHSTEFFELQHNPAYQGNGRIKVNELWVPAAMVLETATTEQWKTKTEFVLWRQEARHRLLRGEGIKVFSKPKKLKSFLEENGLTVESRRGLIVDAGKPAVPGFSLEKDGVEFFCHSPFVKHVDEGDDLRNDASLILQVRFEVAGIQTNYLAVGDSTCGVLEDIVHTTKEHENEDRLEWHLFNIPHHCSHHALNSDDKGDKETVPLPLVKELLMYGQSGAYIVSSSKPIPDTKGAYQQELPPHIQARKCYERYLRQIGGRRFVVTMEEPNERKPQPLEFDITSAGVSLNTTGNSGVNIIVSSPTPRAG